MTKLLNLHICHPYRFSIWIALKRTPICSNILAKVLALTAGLLLTANGVEAETKAQEDSGA
jgi:hypothetical protein